jgi:hypothetical protein
MKLRNRRETPQASKAPRDTAKPSRSDALASETARWVVDPKTGEPLSPRAQPGYYPGYSTLSQQPFWDEATRRVILDRINNIPPIRFFSPEEAKLIEAVCARLLPQDDRDSEHRIPLLPFIDERLYAGRIDGYQYEDMPSDTDAYHLGLRGIQAIAQALCGVPFEEASPNDQDRILKTIRDDAPPAGEEIWRRVPPKPFWSLMLRDVIEVYYAHPWAWDEIGFGGPAYPRGYMRLEGGKPEPWEKPERRYDWAPPPDALSGEYTPADVTNIKANRASGQEGTH